MTYQSFFWSAPPVEDACLASQREHMLSAVVQHTPECIKLITRAGTLLDMNAAGLALIEADDWSSVKGANVYDLMAPEHLEVFRDFNERVCDGSQGSLEFEIIALRGTRRWMHTTAVPFCLPTGEVAHFAITRDITLEKQRQRELEEAKARAEAANRAKSEFLANMSHEIRTPMTAILGFSEMLMNRTRDEEDIDALTTIQRNGQHLLEVINDILDLSKIEAGKLTLQTTWCSPREIVLEVASLMEIRCHDKQLDLQIRFEGPLPERIQSDPIRLRQIVINILGNAIKFTPQGTIQLVTRWLNPTDGDSRLEISIEDTGIGMSPDQIERLFHPFTQADSSTSRLFGGTGLGLSISRRLAKMLGGDIHVTSQLGQGSTFRIVIATGELRGVRILDPHACPTRLADRPPLATSPEISLDSHVLLVEDGLDNQRLISSLLRQAGATVTIVENGLAALETTGGQHDQDMPFDVVLMDMQMPVMDGYTATQRLRSRGFQIPILALTAHAMNDERRKCRQAGCDAFLTKPIDRVTLIQAVHHWSRLARATRQSSASPAPR